MLSMTLDEKAEGRIWHCLSGVQTAQSFRDICRLHVVCVCLLCLVEDVVGRCHASREARHDDVQ